MQDQFALRSHMLASKAMKEGRMKEESTPVYLAPEYKEVISEDIGPRDNQTMEALAKLKPFFDKATGSITAGNSCPITDGAAMVLLMSRERAESWVTNRLRPFALYGFAGLEPERMGLGPAYAKSSCLEARRSCHERHGTCRVERSFRSASDGLSESHGL